MHTTGSVRSRRRAVRLRLGPAAALFGLVILAQAVASAGVSAAAGGGPVGQRLSTAKARLAALERRIVAQSNAVATAQARLIAALSALEAARQAADRVEGQLDDSQIRLRDTQASYQDIQSQLDARAVNAYMFGPQAGLEVLLGASSAGDLNDRVGFLDALAGSDSTLAHRTADAAVRLGRVQASRLQLLRAKQSAVAVLEARESDVAEAFAAQQAQLAALTGARAQLLALVASLQRTLDRQERQSIGSLNHRMSVEGFDQWAKQLLPRLGDQVCVNDRIVIVSWETAEFTKAAWNPLATTHWMPGSTNFNSAGVKNYVSLDQGLRATIDTLRGGRGSYGYGAILDGLSRCDDPMTTALAINASAWCHGCAGGQYVIDVVPIVEAYFHQHGMG